MKRGEGILLLSVWSVIIIIAIIIVVVAPGHCQTAWNNVDVPAQYLANLRLRTPDSGLQTPHWITIWFALNCMR